MPHIVTVRAALDPELVYLCTPPDLRATMGGFQQARYVGDAPPVPGVSYVLTTDELPRFRSYCSTHAVRLIDARGATRENRPYGRENPLPECRQCGQPARRGAHLEHCPSCGTPWDPIELGAPYIHAAAMSSVCDQCSSTTLNGYAHCIYCGAPRA